MKRREGIPSISQRSRGAGQNLEFELLLQLEFAGQGPGEDRDGATTDVGAGMSCGAWVEPRVPPGLSKSSVRLSEASRETGKGLRTK